MINHFGDQLVKKIRHTKSFLCLGIDPHLDLIPKIFEAKSSRVEKVKNFCFSILDVATNKVAAIKPQIAFFEQLGPEGMKLLSELCLFARSKGFLVIMDAKRGDIGSTSQAYANTFLGEDAPYPSDALTINPWLGLDSLEPFFQKVKETGCGLFILVHTSNPGAKDLQEQITIGNKKIYEILIDKLNPIINKNIGKNNLSSIGIVTGATYPTELKLIRKKLFHAPFLIPGYGKQGGSIDDAKLGLLPDKKYKNKFNSGIINSSRDLCFPICANSCNDIKSWKKEIYKNLEENISNLHL